MAAQAEAIGELGQQPGAWSQAERAADQPCGPAGKKEYEHQIPRDQSLLHSLMAAKQKDTGQPLTDTQICAQSFTFILAGQPQTPLCLVR